MYLWYIIENVNNTFETSLPSKTKYIIYISALCHLINNQKSYRMFQERYSQDYQVCIIYGLIWICILSCISMKTALYEFLYFLVHGIKKAH